MQPRIHKFLKITLFLGFTFISLGFMSAYAQEDSGGEDYVPNPQCIGTEVGQYVSSVMRAFGNQENYGNIYFISPAFNTTHPRFEELVQSMSGQVDFGDFYAVTGNAYNMPGGTVTGWVARLRAATQPTEDRVILTETGWYPPDRRDVNALQAELSAVKADAGILGAALFDVFGNNADPQFAGHVMSDPEISTVCSGPCGKIGANSAVYYSSGDDFYGRAGGHNMGITVEIANNDNNRSFPSLMPGINAAHSRGMTPVLRFGVGDNSGGFDQPQDMIAFIQDLEPLLSDRVYLIVGPNEPITECWASPRCGCDESTQTEDEPVYFSGKVRTTLPTLSPDGTLVSNAEIRGAAIALYEGTWDCGDSGNCWGRLNKYNDVTTDGDGNYTIEGVLRANGGSHDNSIWMYVWCGTTLVDQWKLDLSLQSRTKDLFISCASNNYDPSPRPPDIVELNAYAAKLQCSEGDNFVEYESYRTRELGPGQTIPIKLVNEDVDTTYIDACEDGDYPQCLLELQDRGISGPIYPPDQELSARADFSKVGGTFDETFVQLMGSYAYGRTDPTLSGAESVDDNRECIPESLPECTEIMYANSILGDPTDIYARNTTQMYSMAATLSTPGMWADLYAQHDPDECICRDLAENPVRLCEIEIPSSFPHDLRSRCSGYDQIYTSDYFPYLSLVGDKSSGTGGQSTHDGTADSYTPENAIDGRLQPFKDSFLGFLREERPYSTHQIAYWPGGSTWFSKESVQLLSDSSVANSIGQGGALGGVLGDPTSEFGYNSETGQTNASLVSGTPASNVVQVGRGDFQFRPYELCTCDINDVECLEAHNNAYPDYDSHSWTNTYRYIVNTQLDQGLFERICNGLLGIILGVEWFELNGCTLGTGSELEQIENIYEITTEPAGNLQAVIEGATILDWDPGLDGITGTNDDIGFSRGAVCIPVTSRLTTVSCEDVPDEVDCEIFDCFAPNPLFGDPGEPETVSCEFRYGCTAESVCGEVKSCNPTGIYTCRYEVFDQFGGYGTGEFAGDPRCIGDLRADYESIFYTGRDPNFNVSPGQASLNAALVLFPPNEELTLAGLGAVGDQPTGFEEGSRGSPVAGPATSAFNRTGEGGAPTYTGLTLIPVADPGFLRPFGQEEASEWGDQLPDPADPGGSGGSVGSCNLAPDYSPCSVRNLENYFPPEAAVIMSVICNRESGGSATAVNDTCLAGNARSTYDYSVGLFQINLADADPNTSGVFPGAGGLARCARAGFPGTYARITGCNLNFPAYSGCIPGTNNSCVAEPSLSALGQCANHYMDPEVNIRYAQQLLGCTATDDFSACTGWSHWGGLPTCLGN